MMKHPATSACGAFVLTIIVPILFISCATTTINIRILMPSQTSLNGIKKLAVSDFESRGEVYSPVNPVNQVEEKFTSAEISQLFINAFIQNGYYTVLDRREFENKINASSLITPEQAATLGSTFGVQGILFGKCDHRVSDKVSILSTKEKTYRTSYNSKGIERVDPLVITRKKYTLWRKVDLG